MECVECGCGWLGTGLEVRGERIGFGLYHHVVVVGPTRKMVEGSNNRFYAHRSMVSSHLACIRIRWSTGGPLHLTSRCPTSTGAVHKSVTFRCVLLLVQLNKCVVCGSDL